MLLGALKQLRSDGSQPPGMLRVGVALRVRIFLPRGLWILLNVPFYRAIQGFYIRLWVNT